MSPYFRIMPVDASTIKTRIRIHPDLFADPVAFVRDRSLPVRTTKPSQGSRKGRPTWNLTLDILTYKGIKVKLTQIVGDPLASITIDFNPGVCLFGVNGRILSLTEFLAALALLLTHLTPLLFDPEDAIDLVPGLRQGGPAYWSYLEIPFQTRDTNGTLLSRFRHLRHPQITTPTRHWRDSILVGGDKSKLRFSIYRKGVEMMERRKLHESRTDASGILRLEARMKGGKLLHYIDNERNIEVIDGQERLVRFYPQDLVRGHRTSFSELLGVYSPGKGTETPGKTKPLAALGRLLAQVANDPRTTQTCPELMALVEFYSGASSTTVGKLRKAGNDELSRVSTLSPDELFSDVAYDSQFGIASTDAEHKIRHDYHETVVGRLLLDAYRPLGQPFFPHVEWPSHDRYEG